MTFRERILSVMRNETPDKIPFIPRLELWYDFHSMNGTLPKQYEGKSLDEIQTQLGVGKPARDYKIFETCLNDVNITAINRDTIIEKTYHTPLGSVSETLGRISGSLYGWQHLAHMIKNVDDYKVVEYIIEHTTYMPKFTDYAAYDIIIGDHGYPMVETGYDPMFKIIKDYIGYNNAYFEYADNTDHFQHLFDTLENKMCQLQNILINSPAMNILHGYHYDSMMTPPPIFDKYIKPYLREFADKLHHNNKILTIHADGDSKLLLNSFFEAGIDMVDCFCTFPMVNVSLKDAFEYWKNRIIIWGGIPSTLLCPSCCSYDDFQSYIDDMFKLIKKNHARIILGIADNVMPEADIGRVEKITEMVSQFQF